tara:strand:- start:40 stop:375 length:336 start_codon:yes stop_codon:yes gene_type:complete
MLGEDEWREITKKIGVMDIINLRRCNREMKTLINMEGREEEVEAEKNYRGWCRICKKKVKEEESAKIVCNCVKTNLQYHIECIDEQIDMNYCKVTKCPICLETKEVNLKKG